MPQMSGVPDVSTTVLSADHTEDAIRARRYVKDGLLFLGAGVMAMLSVVGIVVAMPRDNVEMLTGLGVGGAAAVAFLGIGLLKLFQARRAGQKSFGLSVANVAGVVYLGVLFTLICGYLLPLALGTSLGEYKDVTCWTLPLLIALGFVIFNLRNSAHSPARRGGFAIAGCLLCLVYIWGFLASARVQWLLLGVHAHMASDFWSPTWRLLNVALSIAGVASIILLLTAAYLFKKQQADARSRALARAAVWWCLGLMIATIACFVFTQLANYWGVVAAIILGGGALSIGSALAQIRQPGAISMRRRALFTAPLLLLALPLFLTAGIAGSALSVMDEYYMRTAPMADWVWHVPEVLRAPLAKKLASLSQVFEIGAYSNGLVSTADLQAEALSASPRFWRQYGLYTSLGGDSVWRAWCERDPQSALAAAVAVAAQPVGSKLPATGYDLGAGTALGLLGSDEQIRAHLDGSYSAPFVDGMVSVLSPARRLAMENDVIAYYSANGADRLGWYWLSRNMPQVANAVTVKNLQAPSATNYLSIELALGFARLEGRQQLSELAMQSDDTVVRKIALVPQTWYTEKLNEAQIRRLLPSARGQLPNSDPNEQRLAAEILASHCRIGVVAFASFHPDPKVAGRSLTATEVSAIAQICSQVEALLPVLENPKPPK